MDSKVYYEIWNRVERAAFMPEPKKKHMRKWLVAFDSFFNRIFEKPNMKYPKYENGKFSHSISYEPGCIKFNFEIKEDYSGFSFRVKYIEQTIIFEYNNREACEFDYLFKYCDEKAGTIEKETLIEVLKQKIDHPAVHLHISDNDSLHEIRLGIATKNPFVFLYQFAFQLIA